MGFSLPVRSCALYPLHYPVAWCASPAALMRFWKCALSLRSTLPLFPPVAWKRNHLTLDSSSWGIFLMSARSDFHGQRRCVDLPGFAVPEEILRSERSAGEESHTGSRRTSTHCQYLCGKRHPAFWMRKSHPWVVVITSRLRPVFRGRAQVVALFSCAAQAFIAISVNHKVILTSETWME